MNLGIEMVAAILGLALGLPLVLLYKRLVADRGEARQGFADLDVQLKRRVELTPRLLETVRGHASREKAVLSAVTGLRSAILSAPGVLERLGHEIDLGAELRKLIGLQEAYPPLRADPDFRELSTKLAEIEEQLEFARRSYNDAVMQYVKRLESFPGEIVAKLFGFEPMPFFESDARASTRRKSGSEPDFP